MIVLVDVKVHALVGVVALVIIHAVVLAKLLVIIIVHLFVPCLLRMEAQKKEY